MEEYRRNVNEMGDLIDVSYIRPNNERAEIAALKSIKSSFFNNVSITLSRLIMTTNLIILGHTLYENKDQCSLFILFQIGIIMIEILGKFFILGLIKYLFQDKEDNNELYVLFIRMKTILVIVIPILLGPICLLFSFLLMELLLKYYNLDLLNQSLIKEFYYEFLIFAPVIFLFEILFLLNLQFLKYQKRTQSVFIYVVCFLVTHIALSFVLVYLLDYGLIGLTISYFANSFIYYVFSNQNIKKSFEEIAQNIFFLIPSQSNFDGEVFNLLKGKSLFAIYNLGDILFLYLIFFMSLFTEREQLIVNIIYLNFYELIFFINKGFYFSLKIIYQQKLKKHQKDKNMFYFLHFIS